MRDNDIIILELIIMAIVCIFFGALGLGFHGQMPDSGLDTSKSPGILEVIKWAWNGMGFIVGMMSFQVEGVPVWMNFFFIIAALLLLWIFLKWVRGSNQGV